MKFLKFLIVLNIILAFIFGFYITCFAENTAYVWSNNASSLETSADTKESENENSLNLESGSAILIEQTTRSNFICT